MKEHIQCLPPPNVPGGPEHLFSCFSFTLQSFSKTSQFGLGRVIGCSASLLYFLVKYPLHSLEVFGVIVLLRNKQRHQQSTLTPSNLLLHASVGTTHVETILFICSVSH